MKKELNFESKFSKTFGLTVIHTSVMGHLNILQGRRGKRSPLTILPSTVAWVILDFTCIPCSHCSVQGHISIDVSIKPASGLEQPLLILQFNRETDHVKWEVTNIFLEHISKFTQYASFPFTGIFIACLF